MMKDVFHVEKQIHYVNNFQDFVSTPFHGETNAICWTRQLIGDFSEIVNKIEFKGNIIEIEQQDLLDLQLTYQGQLAREILLNDFQLLKAYGAAPILNVIQQYERDEDFPFFPTDVYSFHVDRSPISSDTFLCTYFGEPSEIIANDQVTQKTLIPEIREQLKKLYNGVEANFDAFLSEHFFDLHYQAKPSAIPYNLGLGHLWRLAVDHPESKVLPCIHRAPKEQNGEKRLLLIC